MNITPKILKFIMTAVLAVLLPLTARAQSDVASKDMSDLYRIGPGDVLEVRVFNRPQLSRESIRVDNRGMISMPMIENEIVAGCRTESELALEIAKLYLPVLRNPHVNVFVKEFNSNPVAVIGAVSKPGQFQLQRRIRLLELISLAGGPTENAGERALVAHGQRTGLCSDQSASEGSFVSYNLNNTLKGQEESNPYAQPGDIVTIPEAQQAFVVGNVFKPGAIFLKERITVSQAVAMAGGALSDSKKDRVRVLRQLPANQTKTEIVVDLTAISRLRAEDIEVLPNDIIEVPTSSGRRFLRALTNAVAPMTMSLPLRVVR